MRTSRRNILRWAGFAATVGAPADRPPIAGVYASGSPKRSESGVGALMPWADRLWAVTYLNNPGNGEGSGLWEIDENLRIQRRHVANSVYANRLLHAQSDQINIGAYFIDAKGTVRVCQDLRDLRLTASMTHLKDPANKVYVLTMEGVFCEVDVHTLRVERLFDLVKELGIRGQPHFKGGFTAQNRTVIANNTYGGPGDTGGRLAEFDGSRWTVLERTAFMEVAAYENFGNVIFATGFDDTSAILKVCADGKWSRYRLPKSSHTFDHFWQTEWTRIREVETQRFLMDCHGMFYELSPTAYQGAVWGVRPICSHLRVVPDFCTYRGMFAMGGNQGGFAGGNLLTPQAQSGIWFGKTDDLWGLGKPQGWGGPWRETEVSGGIPSDPFLMTGFEGKVLHLSQRGGAPVRVDIQVDFLGTGTWKHYESLMLPAGGYKHHVFPPGFSAHWVRLAASEAATLTAEFIYT